MGGEKKSVFDHVWVAYLYTEWPDIVLLLLLLLLKFKHSYMCTDNIVVATASFHENHHAGNCHVVWDL